MNRPLTVAHTLPSKTAGGWENSRKSSLENQDVESKTNVTTGYIREQRHRFQSSTQPQISAKKGGKGGKNKLAHTDYVMSQNDPRQ